MPMPHSATQIRIAAGPKDREAVYAFRYQIYVEEMGKQLGYADPSQKMLLDDLDEMAHHYLVEQDGKIIATARLNYATETPFGDHWRQLYQLAHWDEFPAEAISMSSRLMVAPEWRGSSVLGALLLQLFEHSRARGVRFNFLNCSPSLLEFYEQLGYRRYADGFVDTDVGYRVPMVFMTEDVDYMRLVHSPFLRLARKLPSSGADTQWFESKFPGHAAHVNRRLVDAEGFWSMLEQNLHTDPRETISLLTDLDEEEAQQFLKTGTVLPCKAGDIIIRPGDVGDEMFVILDGAISVWGGDDDCPVSLALLGPGQIFGEIAFVSKEPRTAKVVAETDVKLLILTQSFFRKAMIKMPAIVSKVLLNLAVVLCDRLKGSTLNWVAAVQGGSEACDD